MRNIKNYNEFCSINESFFYLEKNSLLTLCSSVKNLIINLNQDEYKLKYFKQQYIIDVRRYGNDLINNFNNLELNPNQAIEDLREQINDNLLKKLCVIDFFKDLEELLEEKSYEKIQDSISVVLNSYIEHIPEYFEDIIRYYNKKSKNDESWFPLNGIINPEKKISFSDYRKKKYLLQIELNKLQMWLKLNDKKLLILIEGRDGAGKTAIIKSISENMDSTKCRVEKFGIPTVQENKDWFKRYEQKVPNKGEIVIYDRSWYNRAVIEPVMGYCTEDQYKDFYKDIEKFEKKLTDDGVIILKFWYSIDFETQKMRFEYRKTNPLKYWKFTKNDKETLSKFDVFTDYIKAMFEKTNFSFSSWRVIDSNDRKMAKVITMQHILERFEYEDKNLDFIYDQEL